MINIPAVSGRNYFGGKAPQFSLPKGEPAKKRINDKPKISKFRRRLEMDIHVGCWGVWVVVCWTESNKYIKSWKGS